MGRITTDQSHQVMATLAVNANWSQIDFEGSGLQDLIIRDPKEAGVQFGAFLRNGGRVIIGEPRILKIDRSQPFDPAIFVGPGWTIWKGLADGNGLEGDEDQDTRSLALTEIDLTKVQFETTLKSKEQYVNGNERQKRLKRAGHIRLDTKVFQMFWENQMFISESWKKMPDGSVRYMCFDGTILRGPGGHRCILYLFFYDDGWYWRVDGLVDDFYVGYPSVVLAS